MGDIELTEEQREKLKKQNKMAFYILGILAIVGAVLLWGWYAGWWF